MLRTFTVALLAATVLTAPAVAQGAPKTDAKSETPAAAAATTTEAKTVAAKPALKSAKVHKGHRHVAHVNHVKHGKYVKAVPATDSAKQHVRHVTKKPASTTGSAAANAAKPKSGTN